MPTFKVLIAVSVVFCLGLSKAQAACQVNMVRLSGVTEAIVDLNARLVALLSQDTIAEFEREQAKLTDEAYNAALAEMSVEDGVDYQKMSSFENLHKTLSGQDRLDEVDMIQMRIGSLLEKRNALLNCNLK